MKKLICILISSFALSLLSPAYAAKAFDVKGSQLLVPGQDSTGSAPKHVKARHKKQAKVPKHAKAPAKKQHAKHGDKHKPAA